MLFGVCFFNGREPFSFTLAMSSFSVAVVVTAVEHIAVSTSLYAYTNILLFVYGYSIID